LNVRSRDDRSQKVMGLDEFAEMVTEKTKGLPFRPLSLSKRVSQRPVFHG